MAWWHYQNRGLEHAQQVSGRCVQVSMPMVVCLVHEGAQLSNRWWPEPIGRLGNREKREAVVWPCSMLRHLLPGSDDGDGGYV
jgi:hypothetical protein